MEVQVTAKTTVDFTITNMDLEAVREVYDGLMKLDTMLPNGLAPHVRTFCEALRKTSAWQSQGSIGWRYEHEDE